MMKRTTCDASYTQGWKMIMAVAQTITSYNKNTIVQFPQPKLEIPGAL